MYKAFYKLTEKPFTLLPDPGFLYMSDKHRMAATLLEYGLMNQAGFTVISGDIGAGKTTLIRHLLDNMDQEHTVGLISNTHQSFGDLLQWILQAFSIEHKGLNKVESYQRFIDFIIDEYAHNRTTILIIDEAQNMSVETMEELRMLSNVNADKNQALQVILVGQNELRDTLKRPDLVQFAQRISVDYHLQPLSDKETANYIRHRLKVVGGSENIFSDVACLAVHRYSNGIPRLINLLCDTALVYGYAEQAQQIGAHLVIQVAQEKQQGGIFPTTQPAKDDDFPEESALVEAVEQAKAVTAELAKKAIKPESEPASTGIDLNKQPAAEAAVDLKPVKVVPQSINRTKPAATKQKTGSQKKRSKSKKRKKPEPETKQSEGDLYWQQQAAQQLPKKKVRLALCVEKVSLRPYLSRLLESYGFEVTQTVGLDILSIESIRGNDTDLLLVDWADNSIPLAADLVALLEQKHKPVLYNDTLSTEISLQQANPAFGQVLADRIHAMINQQAIGQGALLG